MLNSARIALFMAGLTAFSTPVLSQSLVLGAGFADFSSSRSADDAVASVEYHHTPFHERPRFRAGVGGSLSVHLNGDVHIGAGLYGVYDLADRWFIEGSVMPGFFVAADQFNDIGGEFQIRSLLGVGYTFDNGNSLSLAVTHKSNASTSAFNPGVNAVLVRFHRPF
ncbi:MAG: acyloxyacyl hydrolase [Paracoccaceae bacterium]